MVIDIEYILATKNYKSLYKILYLNSKKLNIPYR